MNNDSNELKKQLKKIAKLLMKLIMIAIAKLVPIAIILVLLAACYYYINVWVDGGSEDDWSSVPYAAEQASSNISIDSNGEISSANTAQEVWEKNIESGGRVNQYLDSPEELSKLINAEKITQYLDTRPNPDDEIDWDNLNKADSNKIQGIIKLKRADSEGNNFTMTYTDPETFERYINKYNESGLESDRKEALKHFTLEKTSLSSSSDQGTATTIEAGTTIKIKSGLGSVHTYMGWQKITSTTSTQYKLREKAGMNFDAEGFGKINGRYVIACTTTFGKVGDYVDFYQEDGTIIPCIIGDIKSRNDAGCNKWGHNNGHCIIEFIVDMDTWYNSGHPNPGTSGCHPEWNKNLTKAVNGGSYFDNPNFGENTISENGRNVEIDEDEEDAMKWPTDGTNITSNYGPRNSPTEGASSNHKGIDIEVTEGTNVYACEDGKVTTATYSDSAGNWIEIDHGNGYVSKYMHNSELKVSVGDIVEKGQIIALSGNTGVSTGAHLHFQIELDGQPVDPLTFLYDNGMGEGDGGIGSDSDNIESNDSKYYAKVATWSEEENEVVSNDPEVQQSSTNSHNMTTTNINYQEFVSAYTMPFDYLWALLVIGEDKDFVLQLADLVQDSEIEITVHDNLTINTNVVTNTYTKKQKVDTKGQVTVKYETTNLENNSNTVQKSWSDELERNCEVTMTTVTRTNTLEINLTKANVWIVDYEQNYTYQHPNSTTDVVADDDLEDKNYPDTPDITSEEDKYGHVANLLKTEKNKYSGNEYIYVDGKIDLIETKIYNATINRHKKVTNTVETMEYISSPASIREKTDKNANEDNFVTILLKDECKKAKNFILEVPSWLFEVLENNEKTVDMVDLTKYLLYKATDKDYGVTEYDFSVYNPENFISTSTGAKSNIEGVPGQIADFFLDKGMPIEGVAAILGNIQQECNFDASNISSPDYYGGYHGLCQWGNYHGDSNGRFAQLEKLAQKEGTDWTNVDTQLKFMWKELNSSGYKAVKDNLMSTNNLEQSVKYFAENYEKCINGDGSIQQLDDRQKYAKEWLDKLKQKATQGDSSINIDTSSFLATAKSCHDYLRENQYWYPSSENLAAGRYVRDGSPVKHKFPTEGEPMNERYVDCSAYVSWVLKKYGYRLSAPYAARDLKRNPLHLQEISLNNVQAGDILVRETHTEIYCGNGKAYSCGSTNSIRADKINCSISSFEKAFRVNR